MEPRGTRLCGQDGKSSRYLRRNINIGDRGPKTRWATRPLSLLRHPTEVSGRRPILTRQNRKSNVASTCVECCSPPNQNLMAGLEDNVALTSRRALSAESGLAFVPVVMHSTAVFNFLS